MAAVSPTPQKKVYDYYRYGLNPINVQSIGSDSVFTLPSSGNQNRTYTAGQYSAKNQHLYLASDLIMAGLTAGPIHSLIIPVTNSGATLNFFKLGMKHTTKNNLQNGMADTLLGYFYQAHHTFVNGNNRLVLYQPFVWDGISNILIEFSFTHTTGTDSLVIPHRASGFFSDLKLESNTALDLSHLGHIELDTTGFSKISNEITVSFWAYGNPGLLPQNSNSILYGTDANNNNRQFNIHLPHSSSNVYFDCGFSAGGYDRINKIADTTEYEGRWNHWVFSKNATTGNMKIFLNGKLWLSGTAKTKPINLKRLVLGKDNNLASNYKGKINQLCIWNKEIADSMLTDLMYKGHMSIAITDNNLIAHYPLNEGSGNTVTESSKNKLVNGVNLRWSKDRSEDLFYQAQVSELNPDIRFTRSNINFILGQNMAFDSVERATNTITEYSITSNEGISPMKDDQVNVVGQINNYTHATPSYIYDGTSKKTLVDSIPVAAEGNLALINMPYFRRFPWFNEIMSFVTPYGIGLNLGANGKTWYFDVSDFAPILKGKKRIVMSMGGQNQEQNDVEFWFIVGTPPRPVLEFNQIYQGVARTSNASLGAINNQSRYPAVKVPTLANGKTFKMRSTITGHGAEGEFEANGGQVEHYLDFNNTPSNRLAWVISQECSFNPIFPQGGTWVYDRQGWCPGEASLTKEFNITDKVKAGDSIVIDYNASTPPKAGAYNYLVAHQLVTYGDLNFDVDARVIEVIHPTDNVLYTRRNPFCAQPQIVVENSGKTAITSMQIEYGINNDGNKQTYQWSGNIPSLGRTNIILPIGNLYDLGMLPNNNTFWVNIAKVQGASDNYTLNNRYTTKFNKPEIIPSVFTLEFRTNNRPQDNNYRIYDAWNNLVDSVGFTQANNTFSKAYNLGGCYKIVVTDLGQDGIQWWANPDQGTGFMRLKRPNNQIIKTFQPDFGGGFEYYFTTNWALGTTEEEIANSLLLYPNPTKEKVILDGLDLHAETAELYSLEGKLLAKFSLVGHSKQELDLSSFPNGIYLLMISKDGLKISKKLVKE